MAPKVLYCIENRAKNCYSSKSRGSTEFKILNVAGLKGTDALSIKKMQIQRQWECTLVQIVVSI